MNQNSAAVNALREYVKIERPGYAFMIEAPWGAGKTHLVKREFEEQLSEESARYISLNGVSDPKAFRRALLSNTSEAKLTDAAGKLLDTTGKIAKLGNVGSLIQDYAEDWMINNLPELLIFDDVERCEMSPVVLLGLINEFVEHQKKRVVLCAFIESDVEKRKTFLSRKEKVVGRTVRIVANAQVALPDFIASMPDGNGKTWFQSNTTLVLEVFSDAKHNNLRVLRQCLMDCGRVIDVLAEDLIRSTDAVRRFVRTFLVLAMALAMGEISPEQLLARDNYRCAFKPKEDDKPHPLYNCSQRHPNAEIFSDGSVVPLKLGHTLIGIGYEAPDNINEALRETGEFTGEMGTPLWARFLLWRKLPRDKLASTYKDAEAYVLKSETIEPGPSLHMAHNLITLAIDGFGNAEDLKKKIIDRIDYLQKNEKIPAAKYGSRLGWTTEIGKYSYGGYAFTPDKNIKPVIEAMKDAQIAAFKGTRTKEAGRLLDLLRTDLEQFEQEFKSDTYYDTAILHTVDAYKFAESVFDHVISGNVEVVGSMMKGLADRHQHSHNSISEELPWAEDVKAELLKTADKAGPIERARMHWFLGSFWRFPAPDTADP